MLQIQENKISLLEEELLSIHQYLTDKDIPKNSADGKTFSIVGRIKWMERHMLKDFSDRESELLNNESIPST